MTTTEKINGRTAAEWDALAQQFEQASTAHNREAAATRARSGNEGCRSQHAHKLHSDLAQARTRWARNHGYVEIVVLLQLDGQIAAYRKVDTQYGLAWQVTEDARRALNNAGFGYRRTIKDSEAAKDSVRLANNRKKGVTLGRIRVAGTWELDGRTELNVAPRPVADEVSIASGAFEVIEQEIHYPAA